MKFNTTKMLGVLVMIPALALSEGPASGETPLKLDAVVMKELGEVIRRTQIPAWEGEIVVGYRRGKIFDQSFQFPIIDYLNLPAVDTQEVVGGRDSSRPKLVTYNYFYQNIQSNWKQTRKGEDGRLIEVTYHWRGKDKWEPSKRIGTFRELNEIIFEQFQLTVESLIECNPELNPSDLQRFVAENVRFELRDYEEFPIAKEFVPSMKVSFTVTGKRGEAQIVFASGQTETPRLEKKLFEDAHKLCEFYRKAVKLPIFNIQLP